MEGPETRASAGLSRGGDGAKPSKDETSPRSAKNRFHSFRLQMAGSHAFANIPRQSNTSGAGGKRRDPFSQNRGSVNRKKKQSLIDTTKDVPQASSMAERRPVFGDMARSIQKQVAGVRAFANKQRVDERERPKQSETISQRSAKDRFHSVQLQVAGTHAFANIPRHGDGKKKLAEDQGDVDHGVGRQTTALERSPWDGIGSVARAESDQVQDIEFTRRQQRTADDRLRSAKQKLAAVTAFSRKSNDKDADLEDQTSSEFSSRQQRTVGDRLRSAKQKLAAVTAFSRKSNDEDVESDRTPLNNSTFSFATQMEMISGKIALRTALEKCSLFCCKEVFFILPLSVFGCITHAFFFRKYFLFGPGFFVASPFLFLSIVCIALPMSMFIRIAMIACPARQQIGDSTYSREHPFAETRASADGKKKLAEDQGDVDHGVGRQTTAPERSPGDEIGSVAREESDQVQDIEFTRRQQRTADDRLRSAKQKLAAVTAFSRKSNDKDADLEDQTSSEFGSRQQRTVGDRLRSAKQKLAAVTAFSRKSNDKEADLEDQASSEFSSRQQRTVGDRLRSADTELDRTSPQFTRRQQCARRAYSSMFSCISSCCTCARRVYSSMFDLNGRFFIFKMYFMEMLATMLQLYNMKHIYLCTMGLGDVYIALSILVFELVSIIYKGELEAIASLKGLSSLLTLEVIGTKLKSLHAETATHIPNLLQLVLIENRLTALPDLSNMTQLTRLHVYSNELTLLPPLPKNIVILFAYNNKLTSLPVTFSGLRQLRQCRLFNNRLAAFPEGIGGLENLEELLAWNNTIEKLPESISHLKKLKAADVRNNKLSVLPEKINEIRLMYFSLNGNPICSLGILSGEKCKKPCSPDCSPSLLHNEKCDDLIRVYKTTTLFDPQDEGARLVKRARSGSGCFTEACKKDDGACSIERGDPLPFRSD
eukprot:Stramenopile-MAST_4_protein_2047